MKKCLVLASVLAAAMQLAVGQVWAAWPEKPVKVIVPFGAGGATGTTARIFQKAIADNNLMPQSLTIINVPGAGGTVGARQAKDEPADGYTFFLSHLALMSAEGAERIDFGYRDFESVAGTTDFCHVAVVPTKSSIESFESLLNEANSNPDSIVYAANLGANTHMMGLMMEEANEGSKFRFVQIGGEADIVGSLKGQLTQASAISVGGFRKFESEGLRPLATLAPERDAALPDLPTARELGYDVSFCVQHWWFAPKGTPKEAIDGMAAVLKSALETDAAAEGFAARSTTLSYLDGAELTETLDAEFARIGTLAKKAAAAKK